MSSRQKMKKSKDKQIFKKSSDSTKKINIKPNVARGGIRL